jgi:hypothetical protein
MTECLGAVHESHSLDNFLSIGRPLHKGKLMLSLTKSDSDLKYS